MAYIQEQREANRVFGLQNAEHWSGYKDLIDFLDEMLIEKKSCVSKFAQPVFRLRLHSIQS